MTIYTFETRTKNKVSQQNYIKFLFYKTSKNTERLVHRQAGDLTTKKLINFLICS